MSSSQSRGGGGGERMIHQDYIARIRYSNALPPPPNPPKLLDVPNTGLARYTHSNFGSRLRKEQPMNIEVDAELGMPLDLVGMPGVFDGDESSIQAPAQAPAIHPRDRFLLRPLASLGKSKTDDTAVSFLRRTEYISASTLKPKHDSIFLKPSSSALRKQPLKRARSPEPDKGTPAWIKRRIERSFEIAASHLADPTRVKHPSKRNLKVVEAFPLLPDLESFPDSGAYVTVKFATNPVTTTSGDAYDTRLLSAIFKPIERSEAEEGIYNAAFEAWERDPDNVPKPTNMMNYDFYLPAEVETGNRFRAKFDVDNPDRDMPELYNRRTEEDGRPCFKFPRVRAYETAKEKEMDHDTKYSDEVILAYRDEEAEGEEEGAAARKGMDNAQKAVYYYPIMQKSTIRSQRTKNIARTIGITDEDEKHVDELEITIEDPNDELKADLQRFKEQPIGFFPEEEEEEDYEEGAGAAPRNGDDSGAAAGGGGGEEEELAEVSDQDAEGDEED